MLSTRRPMKVRRSHRDVTRRPDVLECDQPLTQAEAEHIKDIWFAETGRRVMVLSGGLRLWR